MNPSVRDFPRHTPDLDCRVVSMSFDDVDLARAWLCTVDVKGITVHYLE